MKKLVDLGTFLPGFYDAEGEMVEYDTETGILSAPCSECGKIIESRCAYDVCWGRRCNTCAGYIEP